MEPAGWRTWSRPRRCRLKGRAHGLWTGGGELVQGLQERGLHPHQVTLEVQREAALLQAGANLPAQELQCAWIGLKGQGLAAALRLQVQLQSPLQALPRKGTIAPDPGPEDALAEVLQIDRPRIEKALRVIKEFLLV